MTDIFSEAPAEPRFDDLVGEGKKFKDPDALAKKAVHADQHISRLESEMQELRTELAARLSVEEALGKIRPQERQQSPVERPHQAPESGPSSDDIDTRVKNLLKAERERDTRETNINRVRSGLKERFGGDYNQKLESIANELSVSKEFLTDMASKTPDGFFKLVDRVAPADRNTPGLPTPQRAAGVQFDNQNVKNNAYYRDLRKTKPDEYFSRKVQNEMHAEALRQGDAFFN